MIHCFGSNVEKSEGFYLYLIELEMGRYTPLN